MAITRAQALSGTRKQREFFSDFVTSFKKTPAGDQLGRVINEDSVNQSLRNLIKTNIGERLFQPILGSDIYALLFEHNTDQNRDLVTTYIRALINNNEPRVNLLNVELIPDLVNENRIEVNLTYNLINNPDPINLTILLKRVR